MMDFLQQREWGLMILDGEFNFADMFFLLIVHSYLYVLMMILNIILSLEVQTCPADKFRRTLSGTCV